MHLECHPFYLCTEEERYIIRKELGITDTTLQEDIDAILEWFHKEPHLADAPIDRDYVEKMVVTSKGSREKAKRRIDTFYKHRFYSPELVQARVDDLSDPNYNPWTFFRQCAMPKLYNGKRISIFTVTDPNPNNFVTKTILQNTILLGDLRLKFDYMLGDIFIMDLRNGSLGHILRINPVLLQKFIRIIQDGIGFKLYNMHVLNASSFSQHFIKLCKQFVKPKILDRIVFHADEESLHKCIPKEHLPKDYGGEQPSLDEFRDMYTKELLKPLSKDYLLGCCRHISDERKRIGEIFDEEYLIGSFRKLDVD